MCLSCGSSSSSSRVSGTRCLPPPGPPVRSPHPVTRATCELTLAPRDPAESFLLFKPGVVGKLLKSRSPRDEEEGSGNAQIINESSKSGGEEKDPVAGGFHASNSVFTWSKVRVVYKKHLTSIDSRPLSQLYYTVGTAAKPLVLLNDVQGWCKPGTLTASVKYNIFFSRVLTISARHRLMGSSGAGKTTLLDCLAQRKDEGTLRGEVLM